MAKQTAKLSGTSRIRLIVLDAELGEGNNVGDFVNAMQQALKPPQAVVQRIAAPTNGNAARIEPEIEAETEEVDADFSENTPAAQRAPRARRSVPKMPGVVDIDMNAPVSLAEFAQGKDAGSQAKKYLIAAAWLKEHRGIDAVTDAHMYTCFKSMGWSTSIPDFSQPLRDLKAKHRYFEKSDKGYEINHLGLDAVKKLGGNGAG